MMKQIIWAARGDIISVLLADWAVTVAGTAAADPTPAPSPGYQIPTPNGPVFPGVQTYQPACLTAPLACGFRYHPDTGTWQPGTASR
jgi:hypothetical protein